MGGQLLLAVLILVFLFLLPSASPRTGASGGEGGEESGVQFTIEDVGGGLHTREGGENGMNGHSGDGSGLYMGSDVVRGNFYSVLQ